MLFVPELKVEGEQIHLQLILSIIIRNIFSTYPKIRYLFNIARNILLETRKREVQTLQVATILKEISLGLSLADLKALKREFHFEPCENSSITLNSYHLQHNQQEEGNTTNQNTRNNKKYKLRTRRKHNQVSSIVQTIN